ncbi:hypothetical protein F5051DRAFT_447553 [Lentinula edodes]|nr:hypothetical protein F5051DRAFT_447553 [Lentinula edodes]
MSNWPWPRMINPHYEEVKAASDAWFHSFAAFDARAQLAFDKCNFGIALEHLLTSFLTSQSGLLAALAYPWASKEHLGTELLP